MSEDVVTLQIQEKTYAGWLGFSVTRSIESLANQFRLTLTDNWIDQKSPWPIVPGDKAKILLGSEVLITGYIDEVNPSVDATSKSLEVAGRDLAGDLVDCSASGSEYKNLTLDKLATTLAKPFGITIKKSTSVGAAFPSVVVSQGETVFEVLDKRARTRGVLLISNANGTVEIMKPGSTRATTGLFEGQNILQASAKYDAKDRFSKYTVKSQLSAVDEDGTAGFQVQGSATDSGVLRFRPLVLQAEAQSETGNAQTRAQYEATVRAARSQTVQVKLRGFRQTEGGALWAPNQLVAILAPSIGIRSQIDMLISQVTFSLDDSGTITTLDLKRKDAFLSEPKVSEKNDLWAKLYKKEGGT